MTTASIGIKGNNAIVPYVAATKRTKQYTLSITPPANWVIADAIAIAYADSAGNWRLIFNINGYSDNGDKTAETSITIAGTTFRNNALGGQGCAISLFNDSNAKVSGYAFVDDNASTIKLGSIGAANYNSAQISGDVALASEPTWAAANMEGVIAADVYIPTVVPGTSAGLVSASGLPGNTTGSAQVTGFVGEVLSATTNGFVALYDANNANEWADALSLTINKAGVWMITAGFGEAWSAVAGTADSNAFVGIGVTSGNNAPVGYQLGYTSIYVLYKRYPVQAIEPYLLNTTSTSHSVYVKFKRAEYTTVDGSFFCQAWIRAVRIA